MLAHSSSVGCEEWRDATALFARRRSKEVVFESLDGISAEEAAIPEIVSCRVFQ